LVEKGLAKSRSQAQALLLAGRVYRGEERVEKAGTLLGDDEALSVRQFSQFVSRGGDKLEGALKELQLDVAGAVAADIGASTGGFSDCLLQRGAKKVFAIDVGHGQLAEKLRQDERVVVMERTNARHLTTDTLGEAMDLVVVDASFISLELLLEPILNIMRPGAGLLALVKPQFEVGKQEAARHKGVIKDEALRGLKYPCLLDCPHETRLGGEWF
jgi:23S rRNA (cytidine1920-2'-O)/16S rRNA (cytidine1409-2'-O)-methyltransferase